jgi:hypothetical protein
VALRRATLLTRVPRCAACTSPIVRCVLYSVRRS